VYVQPAALTAEVADLARRDRGLAQGGARLVLVAAAGGHGHHDRRDGGDGQDRAGDELHPALRAGLVTLGLVALFALAAAALLLLLAA
jgi:hypothetical protein